MQDSAGFTVCWRCLAASTYFFLFLKFLNKTKSFLFITYQFLYCRRKPKSQERTTDIWQQKFSISDFDCPPGIFRPSFTLPFLKQDHIITLP